MALKDFFLYSKKERWGIYTLLGCVLVVFVLPDIWIRMPAITPSAAAIRKQQLVWREFRKADSMMNRAAPARDSLRFTEHKAVVRYFPFDPNTLDSAGFRELGLFPKTISTLLRYRNKGGRFRKPEDLYRLYGLRKTDADRLIPFVSIPSGKPASDTGFHKPAFVSGTKPARSAPVPIDINQADSLAWLSLPGIGPALSHRILLFRERLGGFYRVEQLAEVYGLPDSVYQLLVPRLRFDKVPLRKVQVNQASAAALSVHPYIRYALAKEWEAYRKAHGPFTERSALLRLRNMDEALLTRLEPYLDFGKIP